jgi:hypothetical protein
MLVAREIQNLPTELRRKSLCFLAALISHNIWVVVQHLLIQKFAGLLASATMDSLGRVPAANSLSTILSPPCPLCERKN